jgi:predicted dehydrogenase
MNIIHAAVIGMGYIGASHIEAIRRIGFGSIDAVTDMNLSLARKKAAEYNIPKCYDSIEELLDDKNITVVHNCTPRIIILSSIFSVENGRVDIVNVL